MDKTQIEANADEKAANFIGKYLPNSDIGSQAYLARELGTFITDFVMQIQPDPPSDFRKLLVEKLGEMLKTSASYKRMAEINGYDMALRDIKEFVEGSSK